MPVVKCKTARKHNNQASQLRHPWELGAFEAPRSPIIARSVRLFARCISLHYLDLADRGQSGPVTRRRFFIPRFQSERVRSVPQHYSSRPSNQGARVPKTPCDGQHPRDYSDIPPDTESW